MSVAKFYENQEIFVTGGSGFIGKALIEKLLHSCASVGKIYVLMRSKKGRAADERLQDIIKSSAFNRIRIENPEALKKLEVIDGDCSELGLGIGAIDLQRLRNVSIIFHSAASVRFDDELRNAILLNTRGTHELLKIAEQLPKLKVFMHVSTTYCNPDRHIVEEKIYPAYADWRTTIKLAETYHAEILNILCLKYNQFQPNTYTFTKSLAEQIVNDYRHKLPVVVFRPSIVISAIKEPAPGWVDNFNGPVGMLIACGVGIMRTSYADPDIVSDFVPVDIVTRALILAAFKKANSTEKCNENETDVINCATATICPLTLGEIIEMGKIIVKKNPIDKTVWVPGGSITRCWYWHFIRFFFWHIMVAILIDTALRLSKKPPLLLKLQRRIYHATLALHYFMNTSWDFKNENFFNLNKLVSAAEFQKFDFIHYSRVNYSLFIFDSLRGAKHYLLKEPFESSDGARLRMKIFKILNTFIEISVVVFILRFIIRYFKRNFFT